MLVLSIQFFEQLVDFVDSVKEFVKVSFISFWVEDFEGFEQRSCFHPFEDELLNKFLFVHNLVVLLITM